MDMRLPMELALIMLYQQTVLLIGSMLLYSRSHHCNLLQRVLAIYFKFKGLSAKGCDTLHALGITMSSKWITDAVEKLSEAEKAELHRMINLYPWLLTWDNINIIFRVFSQRLDKKAALGCGTAAMVFVKKDAPSMPPTITQDLRKQWAWGMEHPLTALDIVDLHMESAPQIEAWMVDHILRSLLDAPEFDLKSYDGRNSAALRAPPPVEELPCGPEHVTEEFMLGTLAIPEQSYEDNDRVFTRLKEQLGIRTREQRRQFSLHELIHVVGDQLTTSRVRGVRIMRCQDCNPEDRMDNVIVSFGWLHFEMAVAKSIHKQYLGTTSGYGLKHAFSLLERKGLDVTHTQGPFHDNLERAFYDIMDARLRACWLRMGKVNSLAALRKRSPEDLLQLANTIFREHVSSAALSREYSRRPENTRDPLREHAIMFNRDLLHYIVLNKAISRGDIGLMENMLPAMLLRFAGSGSSNYTGETLEMLQGLKREWPEPVK